MFDVVAHVFVMCRRAGNQVMAVPEIMERKNVLFAAETGMQLQSRMITRFRPCSLHYHLNRKCTGTGKTLTYLAPLVHHLRTEEVDLTVQRRDRRPRAVVLVPSRELTQQVGAVAKQLSHVAKLRVEVIVDKVGQCVDLVRMFFRP